MIFLNNQTTLAVLQWLQYQVIVPFLRLRKKTWLLSVRVVHPDYIIPHVLTLDVKNRKVSGPPRNKVMMSGVSSELRGSLSTCAKPRSPSRWRQCRPWSWCRHTWKSLGQTCRELRPRSAGGRGARSTAASWPPAAGSPTRPGPPGRPGGAGGGPAPGSLGAARWNVSASSPTSRPAGTGERSPPACSPRWRRWRGREAWCVLIPGTGWSRYNALNSLISAR